MKIKELIEELSKLNPETTVVMHDSLDTQYRAVGKLQKAYLVKERNQTGGRVYFKKVNDRAEEVLLFYPTAK